MEVVMRTKTGGRSGAVETAETKGTGGTDGSCLVRRLFDEVFTERNFDALGDLVAGEYTEHGLAPFQTEEPGVVDGPVHVRGVVQWLAEQYADLRMRVVATVAENDLVAARVVSEGTNTGPVNGVVPATGRTFRSEQCHWFRARDGKLVEHWAVRDDLGAMLQLGLTPAAGPAQ
jgi:predicted SnoaL-like aldol condensation-catalyzing enzyme